MVESIGLVGIGLVGSAFAQNLLHAGFSVVAYDVVEERRNWLESAGGTPVESPAEVARACGRVILSLMTSKIVREVLEGPDGLLSVPSTAYPSVIIDTTTAHPDATCDIAQDLKKRGIEYLDATISGSSKEIRAREGVFLIGGEGSTAEACQDLFKALAENSIYVGPSGSGARSKLAVNLVLGLNRLALAEGLVFAEALGISPQKALEIFSRTAAHSRALEMKGEKMASGDFETHAKLSQHRKDVGLILDLARGLSMELPLSRMHYEILTTALEAGDGDLDNSAVIREVRRRVLQSRDTGS